jgi:NADH:ubiquinone oxidoreductase subunit 3 (subunit A)
LVLMLFIDYLVAFGLLVFAFCLGLILFFLSYAVILKDTYYEKISAYECGFEPFEDTRKQFDVHFYLTAIIFIIFDLEFIYLFPWLSLHLTGSFRFYSYMLFLILLALGLAYEIQTGALDWTRSKLDNVEIGIYKKRLLYDIKKTPFYRMMDGLKPWRSRWYVPRRRIPLLGHKWG